VRYVAFLRGINVGGKNKVDMKVLRAAVEGAGCTDVVTYLNTGNVVFTTPRASRGDLEARLQQAIAAAVGFDIPVLVRTVAELETLLAGLPAEWSDDKVHRCYVFFLPAGEPEPDVPVNPEVEQVLHVPGAFVWHIPRALIGRSWMRKLMATDVYGRASSRNLTTVRKVAALGR